MTSKLWNAFFCQKQKLASIANDFYQYFYKKSLKKLTQNKFISSLKRRPISIQERIPYSSMPIVATTTTSTTTTTPRLTKSAPEESTVINNRLSRLTLPSNATSIRSDITDNFSCHGRPYGYYAGNLNNSICLILIAELVGFY